MALELPTANRSAMSEAAEECFCFGSNATAIWSFRLLLFSPRLSRTHMVCFQCLIWAQLLYLFIGILILWLSCVSSASGSPAGIIAVIFCLACPCFGPGILFPGHWTPSARRSDVVLSADGYCTREFRRQKGAMCRSKDRYFLIVQFAFLRLQGSCYYHCHLTVQLQCRSLGNLNWPSPRDSQTSAAFSLLAYRTASWDRFLYAWYEDIGVTHDPVEACGITFDYLIARLSPSIFCPVAAVHHVHHAQSTVKTI